MATAQALADHGEREDRQAQDRGGDERHLRVRAQLADLSLVDAGGSRIDLGSGLVGYVLPGQNRRFALNSGTSNSAAITRGTIEVSVNGSRVVASVTLALPGQ